MIEIFKKIETVRIQKFWFKDSQEKKVLSMQSK
jgi:hypothetical protein